MMKMLRPYIFRLEANKAIVSSLFAAINAKDLTVLNEFVAPSFVDHTHHLQGLEDVKQFFAMLIKGFPNFQSTIEDIIPEGDQVWFRITETGKCTGEYRGLTPTGNKIIAKTVHKFRVVNCRFIEDFFVSDELDFYKQIGVIKYTEEGKKLFSTKEFHNLNSTHPVRTG